MKFEEVIGQHDAKGRLRTLVAENRLPHALLFCGPEGNGKMALAMAFASYLLCANRHDGDSCGVCPQCTMLRKWAHPDLHFTFPVIKPTGSPSDYVPVSDDFTHEWYDLLAGGPYFTIEQWLDSIGTTSQQAIMTVKEADSVSHKLSLRSSQGGYKVSLIWLPERMREDASNKMLKLIEEPPSQTVFLMVSKATGSQHSTRSTHKAKAGNSSTTSSTSRDAPSLATWQGWHNGARTRPHTVVKRRKGCSPIS